MIPNMNLSEARKETITPGGYIVRVHKALIDNKYNRLQLEIDIAEGPKQGYYTRLFDRAGFWGLKANLYFSNDDKWKFAKAIDSFRESNADFDWDYDGENDEQKLVGMYVGVITRRNHYLGGDGMEKTRLQVYRICPTSEIMEGSYEVPEDTFSEQLQRLKHSAPSSAKVVDTTVIPGFAETTDDIPPFEEES